MNLLMFNCLPQVIYTTMGIYYLDIHYTPEKVTVNYIHAILKKQICFFKEAWILYASDGEECNKMKLNLLLDSLPSYYETEVK